MSGVHRGETRGVTDIHDALSCVTVARGGVVFLALMLVSVSGWGRSAHAAHPLLTDDPINEQWYAPEGADEVVYVGRRGDNDSLQNGSLRVSPRVVFDKSAMGDHPVVIEIVTDARTCLISSGQQRIEIPIEPDGPNRLSLCGHRLRPRLMLNDRELASMRGRWVNLYFQGQTNTVGLRFVDGSYVNLRFDTVGGRESTGQASAAPVRVEPTDAADGTLPGSDGERVHTGSPETPGATGGSWDQTYTVPVPEGVLAGDPHQDNHWGLSLSAAVETTNAYFYRGIAQENQGKIVQAWVAGTIHLFRTDQPVLIRGLDMDLGLRNHHHWGPTGLEGLGEKWYELDWYGGGTVHLGQRWSVSLAFENRESPQNVFSDVQQVNFRIDFDDSDPDWDFHLSPHVMISYETEFQSDGGNGRVNDPLFSKGVYLEIGVRPKFDLWMTKSGQPVTLAVPAVVGLSLDDYFEDTTGNDALFGYFDLGFELGVPLAVIRSDPGHRFVISLTPALHVLFLGDSLQSLSQTNSRLAGKSLTNPKGAGGDAVEVIGSIGLRIDY